MRACRGKEEATKERYLWRPQGEQTVPRKKPKRTEPLQISLPQRVRTDCQALAAASQIRRCSIAGRRKVLAPAPFRLIARARHCTRGCRGHRPRCADAKNREPR